MTIRRKILFFFLLMFLLLMALAGDLWLMLENADHLTQLQVKRFNSRLVADELRHSSDDLTRMARSYVVTENPRFLKYFDRIMAIREGVLPRPANYQDIYWDFVIAWPDYQPQAGSKTAIMEAFRKLKFSKREFELLQEAKQRSDELTRLEIRAFKALQGRFLAEDGTFSIKGAPNRILARQLLFGEEYHQAKAGIMEKIDAFFKALDNRTLNEVNQGKETTQKLMLTAIVVSSMLIVLTLVGYALFSKDIVKPLSWILKGVKHMEKEDYNFNADHYRNDEIGWVAGAFARMAGKVSTHIHDLEKISKTDPLTGIDNRIALDKALFTENYKFERYDVPCALILLDVDLFKKVNDRFGHLEGDRVLIRIAEILTATTRASDIVGRWGGEEFLVICPNTDFEQGCCLAELIRKRIEANDFGTPGRITASFGVSGFSKGDTVEGALRRSDDALYHAKKEGRNRVCRTTCEMDLDPRH